MALGLAELSQREQAQKVDQMYKLSLLSDRLGSDSLENLRFLSGEDKENYRRDVEAYRQAYKEALQNNSEFLGLDDQGNPRYNLTNPQGLQQELFQKYNSAISGMIERGHLPKTWNPAYQGFFGDQFIDPDMVFDEGSLREIYKDDIETSQQQQTAGQKPTQQTTVEEPQFVPGPGGVEVQEGTGLSRGQVEGGKTGPVDTPAPGVGTTVLMGGEALSIGGENILKGLGLYDEYVALNTGMRSAVGNAFTSGRFGLGFLAKAIADPTGPEMDTLLGYNDQNLPPPEVPEEAPVPAASEAIQDQQVRMIVNGIAETGGSVTQTGEGYQMVEPGYAIIPNLEIRGHYIVVAPRKVGNTWEVELIDAPSAEKAAQGMLFDAQKKGLDRQLPGLRTYAQKYIPKDLSLIEAILNPETIFHGGLSSRQR